MRFAPLPFALVLACMASLSACTLTSQPQVCETNAQCGSCLTCDNGSCVALAGCIAPAAQAPSPSRPMRPSRRPTPPSRAPMPR
ncbi:MAG: hypothetical protein QM765_17280 [Myxococcales bacterium]